MSKVRLAVASLMLTAAGFSTLVVNENFTREAVIPIAGDRPTYGFGSTFKSDGSPVKLGDTITPPAAIRLAISHLAKDEVALKKCIKNDMYLEEWDILQDFTYWRGASGACKSEVVHFINLGKYTDSCAAYLNLDSRRAAGKDCSLPENKCRGVWLRAQERHKKCMELQ